MNQMKQWVAAAALAVAGFGCGPDSMANVAAESDDEGAELSMSELNSSAVLAFVNGPTATLAVLTNDVGLEARAAKGIVTTRDGADGVFGTADDKPFASVEAVDAVPYVGAVALMKLDAWATQGAGAVTVEGVTFTTSEAREAVAVVNDQRLTQAGLSATAVSNLTAARPLATLQAVGAVASVGPAALTALRNYVRAHAGTPGPSPIACAGGTFDGVAFSAAEACHAVEFLNKARFSEMGSLPDAARLVAYESGPNGVYGVRQSAWVTVEQFANRPGIGTTALQGLKTGAAGWTANGNSFDTVASTWTNRVALVGQPLLLDTAVVTKVYPQQGDGGYLWECAELRDSANAPNYLLGCRPAVVCGGHCWTEPVGSTIKSSHGTWKRSSLPGSGGYRMTIN